MQLCWDALPSPKESGSSRLLLSLNLCESQVFLSHHWLRSMTSTKHACTIVKLKPRSLFGKFPNSMKTISSSSTRPRRCSTTWTSNQTKNRLDSRGFPFWTVIPSSLRQTSSEISSEMALIHRSTASSSTYLTNSSGLKRRFCFLSAARSPRCLS